MPDSPELETAEQEPVPGLDGAEAKTKSFAEIAADIAQDSGHAVVHDKLGAKIGVGALPVLAVACNVLVAKPDNFAGRNVDVLAVGEG